MKPGTCAGLAACLLVLGGCAPGDLGARFGFGGDRASLQRILATAEDTPGNQGLLYAAMTDAEAAAQSAGHAVVSAGNPAEVRTALGEVIYAVAPKAAPDWRAKRAGLVPGWAAKGYGVRRATRQMAAELRALDGDGPAQALVCAENTLERAARLLALARRALAADDTGQTDLLTQIEDLALALNRGRDVDGDGAIAVEPGECGLQTVHTLLGPLYPRGTAV